MRILSQTTELSGPTIKSKRFTEYKGLLLDRFVTYSRTSNITPPTAMSTGQTADLRPGVKCTLQTKGFLSLYRRLVRPNRSDGNVTRLG